MAIVNNWDSIPKIDGGPNSNGSGIISSSSGGTSGTSSTASNLKGPVIRLTTVKKNLRDSAVDYGWTLEYMSNFELVNGSGTYLALECTDGRDKLGTIYSEGDIDFSKLEIDTWHEIVSDTQTFDIKDEARSAKFTISVYFDDAYYKDATGKIVKPGKVTTSTTVTIPKKTGKSPDTSDDGTGGKPSNTDPSSTTETPLWEADWSNAKDGIFDLYGQAATSAPPKPTISIENGEAGEEPTLEIKVNKKDIFEGYNDGYLVKLVFEVAKDDALFKSGDDLVVRSDQDLTDTDVLTTIVKVPLGSRYNVRCRTIKVVGNEHYESEWSEWSDTVEAAPLAPESITVCRAASTDGDKVDSIYLEWTPSRTAKTYEIQYSTNKDLLDDSDFSTTVSGITGTKYTITGFDGDKGADEYFLRVRAVGENNAASEWSGIESVTLGTPPAEPRTWSSSSTITVGEPINLYWVHNSMDGSAETYAELRIYINDEPYITPIVHKTAYFTSGMEVYEGRYYTDRTDKYLCRQNGFASSLYDTDWFTKVTGGYDENEASFYTLDTSGVLFTEGVKVKWQARTAGITNELGPWSIARVIDVYAKPTIEFTVTNYRNERFDTLDYLPIHVHALTGPKTQSPIGYYLSVTAKGTYTTRDAIGNPKVVHEGNLVYYRYFDIAVPLDTYISAGDITLENNIKYEISCIASMNSGLTAEAKTEFTVGWSTEQHLPTASFLINKTTYAASIQPYCDETRNIWYTVDKGDDGRYTVGSAVREGLEDLYPAPLVKTVKPLGKNLLDMVTVIEEHNCAASTMNGVLSITRPEAFTAYARMSPMYLFAETEYVLSYETSSPSSRVHWVETDGDAEVPVSTGKTFTPSATGYYSIAFFNDEAEGSAITIRNAQVEVGSTATAYEEYQGVDVVIEQTSTGVDVYTFEDKYYCMLKESKLVEDVMLSVYRREYDGSFTEIAKNIPNANVYIPDPHPSLDYARYRIVATSNYTGYVSYYDLPNQYIGCKSVIIQWDEEWNDYDADKGRTTEVTWAGSLLSLPYNIDVTDKRAIDVEMVKYVGRKHPVSYYGTHLGETASWTCSIPKSDKETLYALRRLAAWAGDVYVREPSGVGYWANVVVNFSQKHCDMVIPVSFEITRVEGGM